MDRTGEYWNPLIETLPREKLIQIELKRFRELLQWAKESSPFYRKKLREIDPQDIRSLEDVAKVPMTEKDELRVAQEVTEPFLYGELLAVSPGSLSTFHQTSGTTGKPVYIPDTYESWQWLVEVWCYILYAAGFRPGDRVFLPFGYNVYIAFWQGHYAAEKMGCEVVPGGALDTKGRLQKMREVKAVGIMNTPTYGLHMVEVAKEMGLDPRRDFHVKKMICAGEPMPEPTRLRLEELWGAGVYDHIGGTEPGGWAGMCSQKKGMHVIEPHFLIEMIDLETMSKPVPPGTNGVAVITPLCRRCVPLIRFNLKDIMVIMDEPCPCGRTSARVDQVGGRVDDLRKIRGVFFSPTRVEEVMRMRFPEVIEFETTLTQEGTMPVLTLRWEVDPSVPESRIPELQTRIREELKIATNLTFEMESVKPAGLPRHTLKSARFKDLRRR
ncbi:MAG: AMP-binding protein [Deltaproteobacteria bacterium]|nr:AMP-binding protein [Deltaproteobacteria bacterium]